MPIYNGVEYAFESINSILAQTFTNWELLIGINGHGETGGEVASIIATISATNPKIRVFIQPAVRGKVESSNDLMTHIRGEWVAILDVDDKWEPTKLSEQYKLLQREGSTYAVIGTQAYYIDKHGALCGSPTIPRGKINKSDFTKYNPVINSSAVVHKSWCKWRCTPECEGMDDFDLWLRIAAAGGEFYNLSEYLTYHRLHSTSSFNSKSQDPTQLIASFKKTLLLAEPKLQIHANLKGGLGNQLFQIAAGYALAADLTIAGIPAIFEICDSEGTYEIGQGSHPSKYMNVFYAKIPHNKSHTQSIRGGRINERQFQYNSLVGATLGVNNSNYDVVRKLDHLLVDGYFQSPRHFMGCASEVRELFTPSRGFAGWLISNSDVYKKYPELAGVANRCAICVRRGDYVTRADYHNPCGMSYFNAAMKILEAEHYYISSDDPEWCRANFIGSQYTILDIPDDTEQLCLFAASFNKFIISNSSYHWWGAYLAGDISSGEVSVVAPDKWIHGAAVKFEQYSDIYCAGMKVVQRAIEP